MTIQTCQATCARNNSKTGIFIALQFASTSMCAMILSHLFFVTGRWVQAPPVPGSVLSSIGCGVSAVQLSRHHPITARSRLLVVALIGVDPGFASGAARLAGSAAPAGEESVDV